MNCQDEYTANHFWGPAKQKALDEPVTNRTGYCSQCGAPMGTRSYVHFRVQPPEGRSRFGCWNHQDNLYVLCRLCHRRVKSVRRRRTSQPTIGGLFD